jgi:hypothetical protein
MDGALWGIAYKMGRPSKYFIRLVVPENSPPWRLIRQAAQILFASLFKEDADCSGICAISDFKMSQDPLCRCADCERQDFLSRSLYVHPARGANCFAIDPPSLLFHLS